MIFYSYLFNSLHEMPDMVRFVKLTNRFHIMTEDEMQGWSERDIKWYQVQQDKYNTVLWSDLSKGSDDDI